VLQPTPAATVAPLRDGPQGLEVLLLRRNRRGRFADSWVFPGGQVEESDRAAHPGTGWESGELEPAAGGWSGGPELAAARRAAVREAREEAALTILAADLVAHSWWMPPEATSRPFATWFFLAGVGAGAGVVVDGEEIVEHRWLVPAAALARRDAGEMTLVPPTWMTLWWLTRVPTVAAALGASAARMPERFQTRLAHLDGCRVALWDGDAGYADGDADRPGARRRLWMCPTGWRAHAPAGRAGGEAPAVATAGPGRGPERKG
jgi:8-oxo-dGTP pyrophosphatase MutT (NUDIX family)